MPGRARRARGAGRGDRRRLGVGGPVPRPRRAVGREHREPGLRVRLRARPVSRPERRHRPRTRLDRRVHRRRRRAGAGLESRDRPGVRPRPDVGCVGGACRAAFTAPRPRWLSERLLQLAGITRFGETPREPRSSAEWPFGANMAFRREALADAGPFSTALGRDGRSLLSGEDSDMVERVLTCGWRVWLEPAALVDHSVAPGSLPWPATTGDGCGGTASAARSPRARACPRGCWPPFRSDS